MPQQVTRRAYAKLNLALAVSPPLPEGHPKAGFHPIASWMACIDLFDELSMTALAEGEESTYSVRWAADAPAPSPIDWPIEKDLAVRAHRLMEGQARRPLPIRMDVIKRIPVGGGLGGGSSDAGAALAALNELFDVSLDAGRLGVLGGLLGSDVPFFLDDQAPARPALVTGLGDCVRRLERVASGLVLIIPPFGTATPAVYRGFDLRPTTKLDGARIEALVLSSGSVRHADLFNDLTDAAFRTDPRLATLSDAAREIVGAAPLLSGSGSTMFVLCVPGRERQLASDLESGLAGPGGPAWVRGTRVVPTRLV